MKDMFKLVVELYYEYWYSEHNDNPDKMEYNYKVELLCDSELSAENGIRKLSGMSYSELQNYLHSEFGYNCYGPGDLVRVDMWTDFAVVAEF